MTGRMPRGREQRDAAIAEDVAVALELGHRMLWLEPRLVVRSRPLVFGLLYEQHGLRKEFDVADVVTVGVGDRHVLDVRRLDPELVELRGQRLWAAPG